MADEQKDSSSHQLNPCARINLCFLYILVLLSAIWFLFVVLINNRVEDPRVQASAMLKHSISAVELISDVLGTNSLENRQNYQSKADIQLLLSENTREQSRAQYRQNRHGGGTGQHSGTKNVNGKTQQQRKANEKRSVWTPSATVMQNSLGQGENLNSFADGLYLRKIQLSEQFIDHAGRAAGNSGSLEQFELIQVMDDESPNVVGEEAILVVSISNEPLDLSSIRIAERLRKEAPSDTSDEDEAANSRVPIYILRQHSAVFLTGEKYLDAYRLEIQETLLYLVGLMSVRKLSVLAWETGALLTLYALALESNSKVFQSLHKVVLVNPFNPQIKVFHSPSLQFVHSFKQTILDSAQQTQRFDSLRLLIISTTRTIFPEKPETEEHFAFCFRDPQNQELHRFENTVTLSSRAMWNVFAFFDTPVYFFYDPFLNLLTRFFAEDSKRSFSKQEMLYFFHYKETATVRELAEKTKRKYIASCKDFSLETYSFDGNIFTDNCIRLLRRQSIYFGNGDESDPYSTQSSILLYSKDKFEVYGEDFERLYPFQSKIAYMVYHIENMHSFRRLFVINRKGAHIHMKLAPVFTPLGNPIVSFDVGEVLSDSEISVPTPSFMKSPSKKGKELKGRSELSQVSFDNLTNFQMIRTCEPANLIFPVHFARMARFGHEILFQHAQGRNCYTEYNNYDFYPDWFMLNWGILRNLMIFSLFCSHVLQTTLIHRFFSQNFVNSLLVVVSLQRAMLFQVFITLSALCAFEIFLLLAIKIPRWLRVPKSFLKKMLWMPVACQLIGAYYPENSPSTWKFLAFLVGLVIHRQSLYIIVIKLFFLMDYIKHDEGHLKSVVIMCLWSYISIADSEIQARSLKNQNSHLHSHSHHHGHSSSSSRRIPTNSLNSTNSANPPLSLNKQAELSQNASKNPRFAMNRLMLDRIFMFALCVCINEEGSVIDETINVYVVMRALLYLNKYFL